MSHANMTEQASVAHISSLFLQKQ